MAIRLRPYEEILQDCLTQLTGGVVNEENTYTKNVSEYPLVQTPVKDISSVSGTVRGEPCTFQKGIDYRLSDDKTVLIWLDGTKPDENTIFYVGYYPEGAYSPVTDINIGSVLRTLTEAYSREVATLYSQIELAYKSGFVDLAPGKSLDFVVSILGIRRKLAGYAVGKVSFFRSAGVMGNIAIPLNTKVLAPPTSEKPTPVSFVTTREMTLRRGQQRIDVDIQAEESGPKGVVEAGAITVMPLAIAGIERVVNFEPTVLGAEEETDEQLRTRAKQVLKERAKATVSALRLTALGQGARAVEVFDMPQGKVGEVEARIDCEKELKEEIDKALWGTKAAGVLITTRFSEKVHLELTLKLVSRVDLTSSEIGEIKEKVKTTISDYISSLQTGEKVLGAKIFAIPLGDQRIGEVEVEVKTWREGKEGKKIYDTPVRIKEAAEDVAKGKFNIIIYPMERTVLEELKITIQPPKPPIVYIDAEIYAQLESGYEEDRARKDIETQVRILFPNLEKGEIYTHEELCRSLDRPGCYTIEREKTWFRATRAITGLTKDLKKSEESDSFEEDEILQVRNLIIRIKPAG